MHAIILAAGRGSRLAPLNNDQRPKCLLEVGGKTLLGRMLSALAASGVLQCDIVVGYEADRIIEHVGRLAERPRVAFHYNPRYEQGSVISLWASRDRLEGGDPVLLLDADVLFHPAILARLLETGKENCFLLDRNYESGDEPVKIAVRDGVMVEFRKQLPADLEYDVLGESVGFFRFGAACAARIAGRCGRFESEGLSDAPHEEVLRAELLERPGEFAYEDITGLPWIEIDFPDDLEKAETEILPAIRGDQPDF